MNRIRKIREENSLTQADLYRKLGWKQSRLANYEACSRTPSLSDAREIVAALNSLDAACSLESVFPESDRELPVTLNTNLRSSVAVHQSSKSAGVPSSIGGAP